MQTASMLCKRLISTRLAVRGRERQSSVAQGRDEEACSLFCFPKCRRAAVRQNRAEAASSKTRPITARRGVGDMPFSRKIRYTR